MITGISIAYIGVIGRSAYWLTYWRPRHISQLKNFSDHLPPAVGASVVEVYLNTVFNKVNIPHNIHSRCLQWYSPF